MDNQIKAELTEEIKNKLMGGFILGVLDMLLSEKTEAAGKAAAFKTEDRLKKLASEVVDLVLATESAGTIPAKASA
jgi:hypothetical protein